MTVIPDAEKPFGGQARQDGCGWTAIRFVANNPGVWPFHCHITWHFVMGMQVIFLESTNKMPRPFDNILICGEVTPGLWLQRNKFTDKSVECGDVISLWFALLVGWCLLFGLLILLTFYCCKERNICRTRIQIN